MRRVETVVLCNNCGDPIDVVEPDEAEWTVSFGPSTGQPVQGRVDLCSPCVDIWLRDLTALLADALPYKKPRPVVTGKGKVIQPEPEPVFEGFQCGCGRLFGTQRGLSRHRTSTGH